MKNFSFLKISIVALILAGGCSKPQTSTQIPLCVQQKIKELQNEPVRSPATSVWEYEYKGQIVYYVPPHCCDFYGLLYDSDCNLICAPDGGLTGKGDGKCPDFDKFAKNPKLIWQDKR